MKTLLFAVLTFSFALVPPVLAQEEDEAQALSEDRRRRATLAVPSRPEPAPAAQGTSLSAQPQPAQTSGSPRGSWNRGDERPRGGGLQSNTTPTDPPVFATQPTRAVEPNVGGRTGEWSGRRGGDWSGRRGPGAYTGDADWRNRPGGEAWRGDDTNQEKTADWRNREGGGRDWRDREGHWRNRGNHDWNRRHRHRDWWRSRYNRFALFGGGYYYWNSGYWYPAYGYDPYFSTYQYDSPIYAYNDLPPGQVLARVQRALARRGYYTGTIDGLYGPRTRSALMRFQRDYRLSVTGEVDETTLDALSYN
jgi:hypothetical protein